MATPSVFIDTRSQITCGTFSGKDEDWPAWCIKFEAYCDLVGFGAQMETAAGFAGPLPLSIFGPGSTDIARALFALLISKCQGKALGLIMLGERHNGLEAW